MTTGPNHKDGCGWTGKRKLLAAALGAALVSGPTVMQGESPDPIVRVEEDWVLVLNEPDAEVEAPQFHTVMSPFNSTSSVYAQTLWNYRESGEDYLPGGLQIQCWNGETKVKSRTLEMGQLSLSKEELKWTQALETNGSLVTYSVEDGSSSTWGTFGKELYLSTEAPVSDLGGYTADYSVQNSWISFGANRVDSLKVTEVRYYSSDGLVSTDTTDRVVYQAPAE